MDIRLRDIVEDSIVDGVGIRMTIFTQGCPHHCHGCHNPSTHDINGGTIWDTDEIIKRIQSNPLLDGITLSGGEPFMQGEACARLAKAVKDIGLNVWTYTGYIWEDIIDEADKWKIELIKNTDVLVDGPFKEELRTLDLNFRGSANQRIIMSKKSFEANEIVHWNLPDWN